jgi:DNA repair protein RadC
MRTETKDDLDAAAGPHLPGDLRALSTAQLLALILGRRCPNAAHAEANRILQRHPLEQLGLVDLDTLVAGGSLGSARASRLLAAIELGRRACSERALRQCQARPITHRHDVEGWARPKLAALCHEEVWLLSLDARHRLKCADLVARGGTHGCSLLPKDVLRPAVRNAAAAIILVHNHPSGDPTPSADDLSMTECLIDACNAVGVPLLDHLVVAREGCISIAETMIGDQAA